MPIGLSYYAFRQIHYAIESYKKQTPVHTIIDYFNYMFFLPTLLVGPINHFAPFLKDQKKRRWNSHFFSEGLERVLYGLVKIIFLGNYLINTKLNNYTFNLSNEYEWLQAYLNMFGFTANSYIQFAGYSDIAIGLSLLFGFRINENFNSPFLASNIADFWRRYHISLSEWCRDYVYFPFLAITRNSKISILLAMLILGIWHEVSLRYLLWGFSHAIAINFWYKYEHSALHKKLNQLPLFKKGLGIFITLHFVMLSFLLISEKTLVDSLQVFKTLFFLKNELYV
jgi:alginate O-acetyltransferase complex protein AlgI